MEQASPELQLLRMLVAAAEEEKIDPGRILVYHGRDDKPAEVLGLPEAAGFALKHFRVLERKNLITFYHRRASEYHAALLDAAFRYVEAPDPIPPPPSAPREGARVVGPYVSEERIAELQRATSTEYDLARLVQLCVELNVVWAADAYCATAILQRAILDHIPPLFDVDDFKHVASHIKGRSVKRIMLRLEEGLRDIADRLVHDQIKRREPLPSRQQVDFKAEFDVLLQEILRRL